MLSSSGIIFSAFYASYKDSFSIQIFLFCLFLAFGFQILSNISNDYGDGVKGTDNHNRKGPVRAIQSGAISSNMLFFVIVILSIFLVIVLLLFLDSIFSDDELYYYLAYLFLGFLCIFLGLKYTMGKNPYGYKAMGDLVVFIFFGPVSVLGSYFLYSYNWELILILPSIFIGFLSMAVLNLNNMRDYKSDKLAKKKTIVQIIGLKKSKKYHQLLIWLSIVCILLFTFLTLGINQFYFIIIPILLLIFHSIKMIKFSTAKEFDSQIKWIVLLTFSFSFIIGITLVLA